MKTVFSNLWNKSKQVRKQRKYRANAPSSIKRKFTAAPLSKELREKYNTRSVILKKGDKIKIMRGNNKGSIGKVEKVNLTKEKVSISGIEKTKKDGSKKLLLINPSNVMILELELDDKKRSKKLNSNIKKGEDKK